MEGGSILGIIGTVLGLILYFLKRRDDPEKKQEALLRALEERIAKTRKTDDMGSADDIARARAERHDRRVRETTDLHPGSEDRSDERP